MLFSARIVVTFLMRLLVLARRRYIIKLTIGFLLVWIGCAAMVYYIELGHNPKMRSLSESIYYMMVTMMTSNDSNFMPVTSAGRWAMSLAMIFSKVLTAMLVAVVAALLVERNMKAEMGLKMHKLENHIVIVGWNLKGASIIRTIREEEEHKETPIVIMADLDQTPSQDPNVFFTRSHYPMRSVAIERASLAKAATCVVLASYSEKVHADALTSVNCMVVRRMNPRVRLVAALLDPNQRIYLTAAGADEIVGIGEVGGFLLAEATIGNEEARKLLAFVTRKPARESA